MSNTSWNTAHSVRMIEGVRQKFLRDGWVISRKIKILPDKWSHLVFPVSQSTVQWGSSPRWIISTCPLGGTGINFKILRCYTGRICQMLLQQLFNFSCNCPRPLKKIVVVFQTSLSSPLPLSLYFFPAVLPCRWYISWGENCIAEYLFFIFTPPFIYQPVFLTQMTVKLTKK